MDYNQKLRNNVANIPIHKSKLLGVIEDFVPINDTMALVTTGETYVTQPAIAIVTYSVNDTLVIIDESSAIYIKEGIHLRLGGVFNNKILYSNRGEGIVGRRDLPLDAEQPYKTIDGRVVYAKIDHNGIFIEDELLFPIFDSYKSIGKPTVYADYVYFETIHNKYCNVLADPVWWEIWRYSMRTLEFTKVLDHGANPHIRDDILFYSSWELDINLRSEAIIRCRELVL